MFPKRQQMPPVAGDEEIGTSAFQYAIVGVAALDRLRQSRGLDYIGRSPQGTEDL